VRVTWTAAWEAAFRIYRGPRRNAPCAARQRYRTAIRGRDNRVRQDIYILLRASHDKVESDVTGPATVTPKDEFPPAPPAGLAVSVSGDLDRTVVARNTESDFKEYRIYRSLEDGPFERIAAGLGGARFIRNRKLISGKRYRYRVTPLTRAGTRAILHPSWRPSRLEKSFATRWTPITPPTAHTPTPACSTATSPICRRVRVCFPLLAFEIVCVGRNYPEHAASWAISPSRTADFLEATFR